MCRLGKLRPPVGARCCDDNSPLGHLLGLVGTKAKPVGDALLVVNRGLSAQKTDECCGTGARVPISRIYNGHVSPALLRSISSTSMRRSSATRALALRGCCAVTWKWSRDSRICSQTSGCGMGGTRATAGRTSVSTSWPRIDSCKCGRNPSPVLRPAFTLATQATGGHILPFSLEINGTVERRRTLGPGRRGRKYGRWFRP